MFRVRCIVSTISVSYITAFPGSIHFLTSSLLSPYVSCLFSYSNLFPLKVCSSSSPGLYYVGTFGNWMGFIPLILIGRVGVNNASGFYFSMRGFRGRDYSLLLGFSAVFIWLPFVGDSPFSFGFTRMRGIVLKLPKFFGMMYLTVRFLPS